MDDNFDLFMNMLEASRNGVYYDFYGIDGYRFCLGIGDSRVVFEAVEDPDDGYRSYLQTIKVDLSQVRPKCGIFFGRPLDRVKIKVYVELDTSRRNDLERVRIFNGYVLKSVDDGHTWLCVGTDYSEDYYPRFTFRYHPRSPQ